MIYIEAQHDPFRHTLVLSATTGFGQQRYTVLKRDVTKDSAAAAFVAFCEMYRNIGSSVTLPSGKILEAHHE